MSDLVLCHSLNQPETSVANINSINPVHRNTYYDHTVRKIHLRVTHYTISSSVTEVCCYGNHYHGNHFRTDIRAVMITIEVYSVWEEGTHRTCYVASQLCPPTLNRTLCGR